MYANTTGYQNIAIGNNTMHDNTTGHSNLAFGSYTLRVNTTGYQNIAIGNNTMFTNTTGRVNIAIGNLALYANTEGKYNTAIGPSALQNNTTGEYNTAIGNFTLSTNTEGDRNTAISSSALRANTTGYKNVAIGEYALRYNTEGYQNTAIGDNVMYTNATGRDNTAIGRVALYYNTTAKYNTAIGNLALYNITTGNYNIGIGAFAGRYIANGTSPNQTATKSTYIGYNSKASANGVENETVVGAYAVGSGANSITLGGPAVTATVLPNDDQLLQFGAAQDYDIQWDGDDAVHTIVAGSFVFIGGNFGIDEIAPDEKLEVNGNVHITGKVYTGVTTVSAVGPTDNVDVASANVVFLDTSGGNVTIGGFINGVAGQVIRIVRTSTTNNATLEYNEGTGNQDIFLTSEGDDTLTTYGGWTLVCNGTHWYQC